MKVLIRYIVILMAFVLGCASTVVQGDNVNISGVVIDEVSGKPLGKINVKLYLFEQGNIFTMGAYKLYRKVDTTDEGKFNFTVEKGNSIQVKTQSLGAQLHGGLIAIDKIVQDELDIVVKHKSDRR